MCIAAERRKKTDTLAISDQPHYLEGKSKANRPRFAEKQNTHTQSDRSIRFGHYGRNTRGFRNVYGLSDPVTDGTTFQEHEVDRVALERAMRPLTTLACD